MQNETRHMALTDFELRDDTAEQKRGYGYAAMFNSDSLDLGGFIERIEPGAFTRSLAEATAGTRNIYALWAHDTSLPLGSTRSGKLALAEDVRGLTFDLSVDRFTDQQRSALEDGDLQVSFGFRVREDRWEKRDGDIIVRSLIDVDLSEISLVINPAYPSTEAALRSLDEWRSSQKVTESITEGDVSTELMKRYLLFRLGRRGL
ncbi:HK97 family phage prohead protease [Sphingobium yanoikuyae]|uniref:HK97 family phage prohead protease n=1 Tax=Sphingobium yanoikuyae TaxID=13690 RepID=UPI001929EDD9|nr:HK97 family phage prohead protease [Sphingobium yanoikuyae]